MNVIQKRNCQLPNYLSTLFYAGLYSIFAHLSHDHIAHLSVTCGDFHLNFKQRGIHSVRGWERLNLRGRQGKLGHCQSLLETNERASGTCSCLSNQHAGRSDSHGMALPPSQVTDQNTVRGTLGRGVEAEFKCTGDTGDTNMLLRGSDVKHHKNLCLRKFGSVLWVGLGDKRQKKKNRKYTSALPETFF